MVDACYSFLLFIYVQRACWYLQEVCVNHVTVNISWNMEDPNRPQRKLSTTGDSLYKILGLEKGASPDEIKKAYRCVHKNGLIRLFNLILFRNWSAVFFPQIWSWHSEIACFVCLKCSNKISYLSWRSVNWYYGTCNCPGNWHWGITLIRTQTTQKLLRNSRRSIMPTPSSMMRTSGRSTMSMDPWASTLQSSLEMRAPNTTSSCPSAGLRWELMYFYKFACPQVKIEWLNAWKYTMVM